VRKLPIKRSAMHIHDEYEWKFSSELRLQFWPKSSQQIYLTPPSRFFPKSHLASRQIKVPPPEFSRVLEKHGILTAAFAAHKKNYYIFRGSENCYTLSFCLSAGNYRLNAEEKKFDLKKGMFFLIPPNTPSDNTVQNGYYAWFEIRNDSYWGKILGSKLQCRQAVNFRKIVFLATMYAEELYGRDASSENLWCISKLLADAISREFAPDKSAAEARAAELLAKKIAERPEEKWTLARACGFAQMNEGKLTEFFRRKFGCSFSKLLLRYRMEKAAELSADKVPLKDIARMTGFADGHSLSLAFKNFYGMSPRKSSAASAGGKSLKDFAVAKHIPLG